MTPCLQPTLMGPRTKFCGLLRSPPTVAATLCVTQLAKRFVSTRTARATLLAHRVHTILACTLHCMLTWTLMRPTFTVSQDRSHRPGLCSVLAHSEKAYPEGSDRDYPAARQGAELVGDIACMLCDVSAVRAAHELTVDGRAVSSSVSGSYARKHLRGRK